MKYYDYSVKDLLTRKFGPDVFANMRKEYLGAGFGVHNTNIENEEALLWKGVDEEVLSQFVGAEDVFYDYTELEDDYLVYYGHDAQKKYAFVVFAHDNFHRIEDLPVKYIYEICQQYVEAVDCVKVIQGSPMDCYWERREQYDGAKFVSVPLKIENEYILVSDIMDCWNHFYERFLQGVYSNNKHDWEILFDSNVEVTTEDGIIKGIDDFFERRDDIFCQYGRPTVILCRGFYMDVPNQKAYFWAKNHNCYMYRKAIGNYKTEYSFSVNKFNQVTKVKIQKNTDKVISLQNDVIPGISIPQILSINLLPFEQIQTYCFECHYDDKSVRIFYFSQGNQKNTFVWQGQEFCSEDFERLYLAKDGSGVHISDKCFIPSHIVFAKSLRQLYPVINNEVIYEDDDVLVKSIYTTPLKRGPYNGDQYKGEKYEIFGPARCFIDESGLRKSKLSYHMLEKSAYDNAKFYAIQPEYSDCYGVVNSNFEWTEAPRFQPEKIYALGNDCFDFQLKDFHIFFNCGGKLVKDFKCADIRAFSSDGQLCCFETGELGDVKPDLNPFPFDYDDYFDHCYLGSYGFMDRYGHIIVPPIYIYTIGFPVDGKDTAGVARLIDGKILWGLINAKGQEFVPCQYAQIRHIWHDGIAYYTKDGRCGLMDTEGNKITEPMFHEISEYRKEYGLLVYQDTNWKYGVYNCVTQEHIFTEMKGYMWIDEGYLGEANTSYTDYDFTDYDFLGNYIEDPEKEEKQQWAMERDATTVSVDTLNKNDEGYLEEGNTPYTYYDFLGNRIEDPEKEEKQQWAMERDATTVSVDTLNKNSGYINYEDKIVCDSNGNIIIPSVHKSVKLVNGILYVSDRQYRTILYKVDGTRITNFSMRNLMQDGDLMTAETPNGIMTFKIINKKCKSNMTEEKK